MCREAGAVIMPHFEAEGMAFDNKDDARKSQVTAADTEAEALILPALQALNPNVPIVAEAEVSEGRVPDIAGGELWLGAPLDGPKEVIQKSPEFTVNTALTRNDRSVLGVGYWPGASSTWCG